MRGEVFSRDASTSSVFRDMRASFTEIRAAGGIRFLERGRGGCAPGFGINTA